MRSIGRASALGVALLFASTSVLAARGGGFSLDPSFDGDGIAATPLWGNLAAVAVQPDGKIVAAGYTWSGWSYDFALARLTPGGAPDPAFGVGGIVSTDFSGLPNAGESDDRAFAMVIDPAGRIVLAGWSNARGVLDFALARYLEDGGLDPTFGVGGKVLTTFGPASSEYVTSLATMGDGIVAAGFTYGLPEDPASTEDFALARYTSTGALDPTFGVGGLVTTDFGGQWERALGLAVAGDEIAAVGLTSPEPPDRYTSYGAASDVAVARYDASGALAAGFGVGGMVTTDVQGLVDAADDAVFLADGTLVVAGGAAAQRGSETRSHLLLLAYAPDGTFASGFGSGGMTVTSSGRSSSYAHSLVATPTQLIVAGGTYDGGSASLALASYSLAGKLLAKTSAPGVDAGRSVALQADGKIVVGSSSDHFVVVRYLAPQG